MGTRSRLRVAAGSALFAVVGLGGITYALAGETDTSSGHHAPDPTAHTRRTTSITPTTTASPRAGERDSSTRERVSDPTAYTERTTDIPQSDDPQDALEATLRGLDQTVFSSVRLGQPPSQDDWPGLWLYATVKDATPGDSSSASSVWEADLAQGAIADRLAGDTRDLASVVSGSTIHRESSGGDLSLVPSGAGDIRSSQLFDASGASDDQIKSAARSVVEGFGMQLSAVRVLHPLGPALYVVATTNDVNDLADFSAVRQALAGDPVNYDGVYFEVDLPDGTPVARSAVAYRTGSGRLWIANGYDDQVGALHSHLAAQ